MDLTIPEPLTVEHAELHRHLRTALDAGGPIGAAARALVAELHPHFVREEQIAMPPLALLEPLSRGAFEPAMAEVLPMTDALRAELPRMLDEHRRITLAAEALHAAAKAGGRDDVAAFAEGLRLHARTEELVLYPASLLVGEWVRGRLARDVGEPAPTGA